MQVNFQLVSYNEELDTFELDENIYPLELDEEQSETYALLKHVDLHLYNWFQKSEFFLNWVKEEVYTEDVDKKFAICDINNISFRRYYFFKPSSGDVHYEYFKKMFDIFEEADWQDREDVGRAILQQLKVKRQELVMEQKAEVSEEVNEDEV